MDSKKLLSLAAVSLSFIGGHNSSPYGLILTNEIRIQITYY